MTNLNNMSKVAFPAISDFYVDKSVFITGGTGFLGKVMIEKLLRSCTKLDKIFMLIREKKDVSVEKRKMNLVESALFTRVKEENPNSLKKIILIIGDLTKPGLGISENDKTTLIDNVSVVFHMAATLRFNEPMKTALKINVEGTQQILDLCHQMKKLDAFVHVSTAYSNTDKKLVEERVYLPPATLEEVYAAVKETVADDKVKEAELLNGRPNTYAYTKALAEYEILLNHGDISTAIVRPSIVTPTLKEPIAGWLDNWNGMTTTLLGMIMGMIRVVPANKQIILDLVPVDIVVNMIIVAAVRCSRSKELMVYNCCSGAKSPNVSHVIRLVREHNLRNIPHLLVYLTESKVLIFLIRLFAETLPAYLMDFWLKITGKCPKYVKLLQKFRKVIDVQAYFTTNGWTFCDKNVTELIRTMSSEDRAVFYCDCAEIHWKQHMSDYVFGIYKYLLKNQS